MAIEDKYRVETKLDWNNNPGALAFCISPDSAPHVRGTSIKLTKPVMIDELRYISLDNGFYELWGMLNGKICRDACILSLGNVFKISEDSTNG